MAPGVPIQAAVEGNLDEAVVRRLIHHVGGNLGTVYGKKGKPHLQANSAPTTQLLAMLRGSC